MSKSKRHFEQEEELLQEVIEQGIQFNDLDPDDEEEFHQSFEHYEDTYEEAKRIYFNRISNKPTHNILQKLIEEINKNKGY